MSETTGKSELSGSSQKWYQGITGYQWLVLAIACLGWIFDVFEGQLWAVFKSQAMAEVLGVADNHPLVDQWANYALSSFLIGGAVGGLFFGILADRIGRRKAMIYSILTYTAFTGVHYFAESAWQLVGLRFFVAMGVGGEWAIAASLVAEVFPRRARAVAGGFFQASSIIGVLCASVLGQFLTDDASWRTAFIIGLVPALLVFWIRSKLKESEKWEASEAKSTEEDGPKGGSLKELLGDPRWRYRALLGLGLASIGLGTYWGIYAWGPELVKEILGDSVSKEEARSAGSYAYTLMNVTGGLLGLLLFAPLSMLTSRRKAFVFYHIGALIIVPVTFLVPTTQTQALILLPIMAFFVVGMHAGYAVYFPELFPTRLRATGASFCFNVGRLLSAVMILVRAELKAAFGLRHAVSIMAGLFLFGLLLLLFAPETKGKDLPE